MTSALGLNNRYDVDKHGDRQGGGKYFQEGGSSSEWLHHGSGAGHCSVLGEAEVVGGQKERCRDLF